MNKQTDNYTAKYEMWAAAGKSAVVPQVDPDSLPRFGHRRFDSYEEFNEWKRSYLALIATMGGVRWKRS
jgi:hypothetical protein